MSTSFYSFFHTSFSYLYSALSTSLMLRYASLPSVVNHGEAGRSLPVLTCMVVRPVLTCIANGRRPDPPTARGENEGYRPKKVDSKNPFRQCLLLARKPPLAPASPLVHTNDISMEGPTSLASLKAENAEYPGGPVPLQWRMLADMRMKDPHIPLATAAKALGFSPTTIYLWTKRPEYQRYETWLFHSTWEPSLAVSTERAVGMQRVKERFEEHAAEMQDRLLAILDTVDDPRLSAQIAHDWLDRAGASAQRAAPIRGLTLVASEELLQRFLTRAVEAELTTVVAESGP